MQRQRPLQMTDSNARRGEGKPGNQQPFRIGHSTRQAGEDTRLAAAATRSGLHALSCADLYRGLVVSGRRAHPLLDLAGHGEEGLLDVASVLGRGLQEWDAKAVSEFLGTG
jgi:hypothetical protein